MDAVYPLNLVIIARCLTHRDSQSAWESRLEREKAEYRERLMQSVRSQLAAHGIGVGFGGYPGMPFGGGGGFYFG